MDITVRELVAELLQCDQSSRLVVQTSKYDHGTCLGVVKDHNFLRVDRMANQTIIVMQRESDHS